MWRARAIERGLGELAGRQDGSLERELKKLGLTGTRGLNPPDAPEPSADAINLAYTFAGLSLRPLRRAMAANGGRYEAGGGDLWMVAPEISEQELATGIPELPPQTPAGIPLLAACSPESVPADRNALDRASRWLMVCQGNSLEQIRADFSARLTRLILIEHNLWRLASAQGGPADRIPYAFRYCLLAWCWTPEAHAPGLDACALCIRCGDIIPPTTTGRPRRKSPPLCSRCAKDPPSARTWPAHAVAPDGPGEWWLICDGCGNFFAARRQARYCRGCKSSAVTPSRRLRLARTQTDTRCASVGQLLVGCP